MRTRTRKRAGLSLLEVICALVIFLISVIGVYQIVDTGSRIALRARRATQAALYCETAMSELVAGSQPLQASNDQQLADAEPGWIYSVSCEPEEWSLATIDGQSVPGLQSVHVTVSWTGRGGDAVNYTLSRLVLDPRLRITTTPDPSTSTSQ